MEVGLLEWDYADVGILSILLLLSGALHFWQALTLT